MDLASQAVISFTEYKIKQRSDMYPVGRARLEVSFRAFTVVEPGLLASGTTVMMLMLHWPGGVRWSADKSLYYGSLG